MIILPTTQCGKILFIENQDGKSQQTIASVKKLWSSYFPKDPFDYFFLDESFGQQYKADILFGKVFGVFAFLAILIACFGLLGLSAYSVLQRTKEIGIRKVLGASLQSILVLLSGDFLKLIFISLLLAIPVGWYIMSNWLHGLCISYKYWLVGICSCRRHSIFCCDYNYLYTDY